MDSFLAVELQPTGPWRLGTGSDPSQVDAFYRSDTLYSAITGTMNRLGLLEEWLAATARAAEPRVRLSSLFPYQGEVRYVTPPLTHWPPAHSSKVRWRGARFIPLDLALDLAGGAEISEEQWIVDGASHCLLPADHGWTAGPFQKVIRTGAAVDRLSLTAVPHAATAIQFSPGSGLWGLAGFADTEARECWEAPLRGAFRLLADAGFGGRRSIGWGGAREPRFLEQPPAPLEAAFARPAAGSNGGPRPYWLLSLYVPGPQDPIDWSQGRYGIEIREGRIDSPSGPAALKKALRMLTEGSVVYASSAPAGSAPDVAPDAFPHPVFRSGFAFAVPLGAQA